MKRGGSIFQTSWLNSIGADRKKKGKRGKKGGEGDSGCYSHLRLATLPKGEGGSGVVHSIVVR